MIDPDLLPAHPPLPADADAWCRTAVWDAVSWLHHGDPGQARQALLVGLHRARRAAGETGPVTVDAATWTRYRAALARQVCGGGSPIGARRYRRAAGETGPVHIDADTWVAHTAALARQEGVRP